MIGPHCECMVAYLTEDDEDPHPCGRQPANNRLIGEWWCDECYDALYPPKKLGHRIPTALREDA
jgi:hypothetical protein